MPEQNSKTPIKRADTKKGDLLRFEFDHADLCAVEMKAAGDATNAYHLAVNIFLLNRPVALPTEPGYYLSDVDQKVAGLLQRTDEGAWWWVGNQYRPNPERLHSESIMLRGKLTLLRPVPEVVAEFAATIRAAAYQPDARTYSVSGELLDSLASYFGVTP